MTIAVCFKEIMMRPNTRTFARSAILVLIMGGSLLFAEGAATPTPGASAAGSSSSSSAALPAAPTPEDGMAASVYSDGSNASTPRFELFAGYSHLRGFPRLAAGNRLVDLNGGSASIAFDVNRFLGVVGEFGGFNNSQIRTSANPSVVQNANGRAFLFLAGPRFSFRNNGRFTPFAQALFGGIHAGQVTYSTGCTGAGCTPLPSETVFAMTAGGGLDLRVRPHLSIRLIQADYLMTNFQNQVTGGSGRQNDMLLSGGLVFRFGGNRMPQVAELPVAYSCMVSPASVYVGDTITVNGTAINLDPAKTATYMWSADGGAITGTSDTASIDTMNTAPGTYTVKGHVSAGARGIENADCTSTYEVKAYEPVTVSCAAVPSTVLSGNTAAITATGISPQNRPLTYTYSSNSGSVIGNSSTATLTAGGSPAEAITVTCNVADDKGHTASATTSVMVTAPVAAARPTSSALCPVSFERDAKRPTRVDNEAKACLDQVALNLEQDSAATLALVGNSSTTENDGAKFAAERAANTKAYLVREKGIDASRITVYTGSEDSKTVVITLIPQDANFDTSGDTPAQ